MVTLHTLSVPPFCRNTICPVGYSSSLPCCWYLGGQSGRIQSLRAVWATQGDCQHFHHPVSSHRQPRVHFWSRQLCLLCMIHTRWDCAASVFCGWLLSLWVFGSCTWYCVHSLLLLLSRTTLNVSTFHSFKQFVDAGLFPHVGFGESHCYEHSYANLEWA